MNAKEKLLEIVRNAKGDDLERAEHAFRNHTPEQLQALYGSSDKTCQQILDEYRAERAEWQAASDLAQRAMRVAWFLTLLCRGPTS